MNIVELRDPDEARSFLLQGLWLQRVVSPTAATVREVLEWAKELVANGQPCPPIGFVADVGHLAFGFDSERRDRRRQLAIPNLPVEFLRSYEDRVLGKLAVDPSFTLAGDALRRYRGRDRAKSLAFLIGRMGERAGFGGVELAPGLLQAALDNPPEETLGAGFESLQTDGTTAFS